MKKSNFYVILILVVSAIFFSSGVIRKIKSLQNNTPKEKVIAVIPKGTINMWWEVVHRGAQKAAKELGYKITWSGPEVETDREKQIQAVEDAVIKGANAVVLGPNDFKALARPVQKIKDANLPCVIIDSLVEGDAYDAFVATDNFSGGAEAARVIGKALDGKGNVIVILFVQNSGSTDARAAGFRETLKKEFPNIKIVSEQYTLGTVEDARQKTVDMLTRYPNINAIFAVNHPTSVGAYKAIQNEKLDGKIQYVGFDSDPVLLEGIENGGVAAIIAQNPFEIGYQGVKTAAKLIEGKKVEKTIPIPSVIVTKSNLKAMKEQYPEALGL